MLRISLIAVLIVACTAGHAKTGCRHVVAQRQAAVFYQPVQQPYFWAVGAGLQEDAAAQRIANKVMALLAAQPQQLTSPQCPDGTCPTPQTLPLTAGPDRWALVKANCAGCHSTNEKAMAHVDMTDLSLLDCETKLKMAAALLDGAMPPKKSLDPALMGNLLGEIVGAQSVEK